ncbi:MAG: RrF2 family transcriptional regulator [Gemmatimonadota bacterium]
MIFGSFGSALSDYRSGPLQLTRESEHAILGLGFLATLPPDRPTPLSEIAEARDLPASFLAKIFQKLARHGIVDSTRGRGHGYSLARPAGQISILDVIVAVEGPSLLNRCILWAGRCHDENPCPLHDLLRDRGPLLEEMLRSITLASLASDGLRKEEN